MNDQLLPVLLLLLLLGASGPQGQEPEGPSGELSEALPGDEVPKEDGVLVLSHHTLSLALQEHAALLVEFCECLGYRVWGPYETSRGSSPCPLISGIFPAAILLPESQAPFDGS
jgi:hypothetical protein